MRILSVGNISAFKYIHVLKPAVGSRAFTLLELIVVLLVIGLIMALVTPRLVGSLTKMNLKTSAQKISSSLRYARSQAVSGQISYHAVFDFEKNGIFIKAEKTQADEDSYLKDEMEATETDNTKAREYRTEVYLLPDGVRIEKAMTPHDEFDSGLFNIEFYPAGNSSGGTVILIDEKERRFYVSVDFITGIVNLTEPDE
jgi:general secretion pathway protein H